MKKLSKIGEYAKEIPEEIRRAISGLDNDYRAAIFVALYKHGELSFSDLRKKLELDKASLYYHLGKLTESALVEHYYKRELGVDEYSFYSVTQFGQGFIEALSSFLRPEPLIRFPIRETSATYLSAEGLEWIEREKTDFRVKTPFDKAKVDANISGVVLHREPKSIREIEITPEV